MTATRTHPWQRPATDEEMRAAIAQGIAQYGNCGPYCTGDCQVDGTGQACPDVQADADAGEEQEMTTTRTYDDIYEDISTAMAGRAGDMAELPGPDYRRARAEQCERLAALWGEVAELSWRDRLPSTSSLSARLLADRYANDAREHRDRAAQREESTR